MDTTARVKEWTGKNVVVLILIGIVVIFSLATSTFLTPNNIINVTSQMSINALLCTGVTFVIITGGIDISIGSVAALAGIFAAYVGLMFPEMTAAGSIFLLIGCALVIGIVCGLFVGIMVAKVNVVPMIATLAMMSIARGFAYVITDGQPVYGLPDAFQFLGAGRILPVEGMPQGIIPNITIFMIVIVVIMHLVLTRTVFGRHVYAVGSNEAVAHLSGVNVAKTKIGAYVICSTMAALGGVCIASKLNNGQPASAEGYEMFAIAATVLGGTSLTGGSGSVLRAMFGVGIIAIINNGMNLMQVSSYWQKIMMGVIILIAVAIDMMQRKQAQK